MRLIPLSAEEEHPKHWCDREPTSFGNLLAQGAVGSASVTYIGLIVTVLYQPNGYNFLLMVALPIDLLVTAVIGAAVAAAVGLSGRFWGRRLGIIARSALGIIFVTLVVLIFNLVREFIVDWGLLRNSIIAGLLLGLPAAAVSDTRLRPLRFFLAGQDSRNLQHHQGNPFTEGARLLLRCASLFFAIESGLYLACLISSAWAGWGLSENPAHLVETVVAVLYFLAGVLVTFISLRPKVLITLAVILNAPLAIWSLGPSRVLASADSEAVLLLVWLFILLWVLFVAGRSLSTTQRSLASPDGNSSAAHLIRDPDSARVNSTNR